MGSMNKDIVIGIVFAAAAVTVALCFIPIVKRNLGKIAIYAILIGFAIVQIFPLYWLILFSFKTNEEIFGGNIIGLPHSWNLSNYSTAMVSGDVVTYFINSIVVTFTTVGLTLLLAAMAGYAISRLKWALSKLVLTIFLLGIMIPVHAALLPLFLVLRNVGLLNSYLALILPYTAFNLPIAIFIFTGFYQTIPREMEESACIDGCSIYRSFFSIILPLVRPAIMTVAIFTFLSAWNELMFAVVFISNKAYMTLPVGIMSLAGKYRTEWGQIGAALVVSVLPSIILYFILSKQVQESFRAGAVKG